MHSKIFSVPRNTFSLSSDNTVNNENSCSLQDQQYPAKFCLKLYVKGYYDTDGTNMTYFSMKNMRVMSCHFKDALARDSP